MSNLADTRSCCLDPLELRALSVPHSLRFLLSVEYEIVLAAREAAASRQSMSLHFLTTFTETFCKLLSLCAARFSLSCDHLDDQSFVYGVASIPLLRYVDYIPGGLHVDELVQCVDLVGLTDVQVADASMSDQLKEALAVDDATKTVADIAFKASATDYTQFGSEAALTDVFGHLGFNLALDHGLNLASYGHLVEIKFHRGWDPDKILREFAQFSGWRHFDLRYFDEHKKVGGILVLPSIQDVCDLLEKYEDEDSDDEGDLLPFVLRPVLPLVAVPAVEDAALRRCRESYWPAVESFWERFPSSRNTVVVYNLYDAATLAEVLIFFKEMNVTEAHLMEDTSPAHRRRAFIRFEDPEGAKAALDLDGKSTRGRAIRVQVAPPYLSESRRGTEVFEVKKPANTAEDKGPSNGSTSNGSAAKNGDASAVDRMKSPSSKPSEKKAKLKSPLIGAKNGAARPAPPQYVDPMGSASHSASTSLRPSASTSPSLMNAEAKEFVPHFVLIPVTPPLAPNVSGSMPPPPSYEVASTTTSPPLLSRPSNSGLILPDGVLYTPRPMHYRRPTSPHHLPRLTN